MSGWQRSRAASSATSSRTSRRSSGVATANRVTAAPSWRYRAIPTWSRCASVRRVASSVGHGRVDQVVRLVREERRNLSRAVAALGDEHQRRPGVELRERGGQLVGDRCGANREERAVWQSLPAREIQAVDRVAGRLQGALERFAQPCVEHVHERTRSRRAHRYPPRGGRKKLK